MLYTVYSIKHSVGGNSKWNAKDDVEIVQTLLNYHWESNPKFRQAIGRRLVEDGKIGPNTNGAIVAFQRVVLKWGERVIDGRVDPGGKTWRGLNANIDQMTSVDTYEFDDAMSKELESSLGNSGMCFGGIDEYTPIRQGDSKWGTVKLNSSKSKSATIAASGCALCTLTMAAKVIGCRTESWKSAKITTPKELTPKSANKIMKAAGAFSGYSLHMTKAPKALGMMPEQYGFDKYGHMAPLPVDSIDKINTHLAMGRPVALHVDYKDKGKTAEAGDHWVLLVQNNHDMTYTAIDPMSGGKMTFTTVSDGNERYKETKKSFTGVLFGKADTKGSQKTKGKQNSYIVVRYILLSPMGGSAAVH